MAAAADDLIEGEFVCLGRSWDARRLNVEMRDPAGKVRIWAESKSTRNLRAGAVYAVKYSIAEGNMAAVLGTARFLRKLDPDQAAQYEAADQAARIAKDAAAREKKETETGRAILEIMQPLRRAYLDTNPAGRLALEAYVLKCLRTHPATK